MCYVSYNVIYVLEGNVNFLGVTTMACLSTAPRQHIAVNLHAKLSSFQDKIQVFFFKQKMFKWPLYKNSVIYVTQQCAQLSEFIWKIWLTIKRPIYRRFEAENCRNAANKISVYILLPFVSHFLCAIEYTK